MHQNEENPVTVKEACEALGWAGTRMSAVRRAMGIRSRYFFLSDVRKFVRQNPNFSILQVYHRSHCQCAQCVNKRSKRTPVIPKSTPIQACATDGLVPTVQPAQGKVSSESANELRLDPGKLFGAKVAAFRAAHGFTRYDRDLKLCRETMRKAEAGVPPSLKTLKIIAKQLGANQTEWLELLVTWLKAKAGVDATHIRIEIIDANDRPMEEDAKQMQSLLATHLQGLDAKHQQFVMELITSKAHIKALRFIMRSQSLADNQHGMRHGKCARTVTAARKL